MSSVDANKLCALFLVKEIIDNAHLGIAASLVCIINGKCRTRIPDANARVAAIAPDLYERPAYLLSSPASGLQGSRAPGLASGITILASAPVPLFPSLLTHNETSHLISDLQASL
ncbi:hypothetical protein N7527_009245 [Penicillium freii]|nr:hypothetical protein N7527_009245 [Penicillium freii]